MKFDCMQWIECAMLQTNFPSHTWNVKHFYNTIWRRLSCCTQWLSSNINFWIYYRKQICYLWYHQIAKWTIWSSKCCEMHVRLNVCIPNVHYDLRYIAKFLYWCSLAHVNKKGIDPTPPPICFLFHQVNNVECLIRKFNEIIL